jgi:aarF domain-containing kinase
MTRRGRRRLAKDARTTVRARQQHSRRFDCFSLGASASDLRYDPNLVEPPLTAAQRFDRAKSFWGSTVPILVTYTLAEKWLNLSQFQQGEKDLIWERLHEWGSKKLSKTMNELKGFYVKSGQLISTRVDLFPTAYITRLSELQDRLDPLPAEVVKAIISQELLEGDSIESAFSSFEDVPLGSASVAQVHKATLKNGKVVAVKVMRPYIEPKLRGDVKNIIKFAKAFEKLLPLDYYLVFTEIADRMEDELDFRAEARAMDKINDLLKRKPDGTKRYKPWLHTPRSVQGMVTKRVLVMDYLDGVTLTQLGEDARNSGDTNNQALAKLVGGKLVKALTRGFGQMVLQGGLFHGDPHPGNIMVLKNGDIALLDFGQTKQLTPRLQNQLSELCVLLEEETRNYDKIAQVVADMGVKLTPDADMDALSACAVWMFDSLSDMPGDYSPDEFSEKSPVRSIASFPQDLVMVGRAAVLIRGICAFFDIPWSVSRAWAPLARWKLYDVPLKETSIWQDRLANFGTKLNFARVLVVSAVLGFLKKLVPKPVKSAFHFVTYLWESVVFFVAQKTTNLNISEV